MMQTNLRHSERLGESFGCLLGILSHEAHRLDLPPSSLTARGESDTDRVCDVALVAVHKNTNRVARRREEVGEGGGSCSPRGHAGSTATFPLWPTKPPWDEGATSLQDQSMKGGSKHEERLKGLTSCALERR
eukprot:768463-Hanusia_phi.AAC.5